jgi:hypothetical protein
MVPFRKETVSLQFRRATAPSRNNLSHANKRRHAALAERLLWAVLDHLQKLSPGFAAGRRGKGLARRFRRVIHVVDSSTIALIAGFSNVEDIESRSTSRLDTSDVVGDRDKVLLGTLAYTFAAKPQ